jgi:hypothetical protein
MSRIILKAIDYQLFNPDKVSYEIKIECNVTEDIL